MAIFEDAAVQKIRFKTSKGELSAEQVLDLPLTSNDSVCLQELAREYNRAIKANADEESFISAKNTVDKTLELKFAIVKRAIEIRLASADEKKNAAVKKAERQQILKLIVEKKSEALGQKSLEELEAMI